MEEIAIQIGDAPDGACGFSDGTKTANAAFGATLIKNLFRLETTPANRNSRYGQFSSSGEIALLTPRPIRPVLLSEGLGYQEAGGVLSDGPPRASSAQA
jgi:hypothetical protein